LIQRYPIILLSLSNQRGGDIKETIAFEANGHLAFIPLILIGITWWVFWRYPDLQLQGRDRRLIKFALFIALVSVLISCTLTLGRNVLMLAVCGQAVLYASRQAANGQLSLKSISRTGLSVATAILLLFFTFSFLRGSNSWDDQVTTLIGYTAASYNRLAAVVNGNLHYPFAGRGMYLSSVVAHSHFLLSGYLNSPDPLDVWASEFGAVSRAGLDGSLIWSGAFGYIFSDLGWFSLPFIFGYGMLYGIVWNALKKGKVLGIVLYPCFAFCALFWVGSNYLLDQPSEILLIVAMVLSGYELLFMRRREMGNLA
jgi:hypothetical protein